MVMSLQEFTSKLYEEMDKELLEINSIEPNVIGRMASSSSAALHFLKRLNEYIVNHKFLDRADEINFFKNINPKFLSKLIYYRNAFKIQSRLPFSSVEEEKNFYLKELRRISQYQNENKEFLSYYRANSTYFDEAYFVRKEPDQWLLLNFDNFEIDAEFTTFYGLKISNFIAFQLLSKFIRESLNKLETSDEFKKNFDPDILKLKWTASKVSLVELIYALQSSGSFNNGSIDIKNLAIVLEILFDIDLGNYYRVFQEIRLRKQSRTTFLDQLKEQLIKRMDEADENPKR